METNFLYRLLQITLFTVLAFQFVGCSDDDDDDMTTDVTTPDTYAFTRNDSTSVSYSGQTDRLNQLGEITTLMKTADGGAEISGQALVDMYNNEDDDGNGNFSFSSSKQLKNKTSELDQSTFEGWMTAMGEASKLDTATDIAVKDTAGYLIRDSKGSTILVDENGREFTQLIEKGLMGAVFFYQITTNYLTDAKTGDDVENTELNDGKNYTAMEHHWDEAFGYFGAPVDFESGYEGSEARYWAKYSNSRDGLLGTNDKIMNAFKKGRAAIVDGDNTVKNEQKDIIYENLELVAAATAIHYINEALTSTGGDQHHVLSEAYAFIMTIQYNEDDKQKITDAEVTDLLDNKIGENFWDVTTTGLNEAKDFLSTAYELDHMKDQL